MNVNDLVNAGNGLFKSAAPFELATKPGSAADLASGVKPAPKPVPPAATLGHFNKLKATPLGAPTPPMPTPPPTHGEPAWADDAQPGGLGVGAAAAKAFPGMGSPAPAKPVGWKPPTGAVGGTVAGAAPKPMPQELAQQYPGPAAAYSRAVGRQSMQGAPGGDDYMNRVYNTKGPAPAGGMVDPRRQRNPRAKFSRTPYIRDMPRYLASQREEADRMRAKQQPGGPAAPAYDPGINELPPDEQMPQPAAAGPQGGLPQPGQPQPGALAATQPMFSPKPQAGDQADIGGALGDLVGGYMPPRSTAPQPQPATPQGGANPLGRLEMPQPVSQPSMLGGVQDLMGQSDLGGLSGPQGDVDASDPNLAFAGPASDMSRTTPPVGQQPLEAAEGLYGGDDPFASAVSDPGPFGRFGEPELDPDYQALMNL